jgi:hypothetical protein
MKKEILIATLFASLMLVTPFTVVARENKVSDNLNDEIDKEELVVQIRTVVEEVLQKYGHIPMIRNIANRIFSLLDMNNLILYCIFLLMIALPLLLIVVIIFIITENLPPYLGGLLFVTVAIYDRECSPPTSLINLITPLKTIFTLTKITDTINLLKDCPCLQE